MAGTKERILDATAELFRRYGFTGTGLKQVVASANAPFGSLYHFFPGGKVQLGDEVVRRSGLMYEELVDGVWRQAADPIAGLEDVFMGAAEVLKETDFADACPIATVALEVASTNETLRQATADVFESWIDTATERLRDAGVPAGQARDLALVTIELLEGAFILCRAMRTTEPLEAACAAATRLVTEAAARADPAGEHAPRTETQTARRTR